MGARDCGMARRVGRFALLALGALVLASLSACAPSGSRISADGFALPPIASVESTAGGIHSRRAPKPPTILKRPYPMKAPAGEYALETVLADARAITRPGARTGGSAEEYAAGEYILKRLRAMGFTPVIESFDLPNGRTSRNIIAVVEGSDSRRVVVGAHMDSKPPSPGANDDAVGCAALLELARLLKASPAVATVEFDFFGTEEYIDKTPGHHHYGSRFRVASMSQSERDRVAGMMTLDLLAVGPRLHARTMGVGPMSMARHLIASARRVGVSMTYLRDPGSSGWADHEPFEKAGIPAVWVERLPDPRYHTTGDTVAHLERARLKATLSVAEEAIRSLTPTRLGALRGH